MGVEKTTERVKNLLYWPGWRNDVNNYLRNCEVCARGKRSYLNAHAKWRQQATSSPMERISVDIMVNFTETIRGNVCILTVIDHFTKWAEAYPLPNYQAETCAEALVNNFFTRFGMPTTVHSDKGSNFVGRLLKESYKLLQIEQTNTTSYHPRGNSLCERINGTVKSLLTSYADSGDANWDLTVPFIMAAYRSSRQSSTGLSPNYLMLGREVKNPLEIIIGKAPDQEQCQHWYALDLEDKLRHAYQFARHNLKMAAQRQKNLYDLRVKPFGWKPGMWVWYGYQPYRTIKLKSPWVGPFKIIRVINDVNVEMKRGPNSVSVIVHVDKLKPYRGLEEPAWVDNRPGDIQCKKMS